MAVNSFNAQNPPVTTKGDLFTFSTIPTRLAVGATNGHVLQVDSTAATGLKWDAVAAGANWTLLNAGGTALTGAATVTVSGISNRDKIMVLVQYASSANASAGIGVRVNGQTGNIYNNYGLAQSWAATYNLNANETFADAINFIRLATMSQSASSVVSGSVVITGGNSSGVKQYSSVGQSSSIGVAGSGIWVTQGFIDLSASITSVSIFSNSGNLDAGTVFVYTSA